jgi:hypothetical protein
MNTAAFNSDEMLKTMAAEAAGAGSVCSSRCHA